MEQNEKRTSKIIDFVEAHFPDATAHNRGQGVEYRFLCPFCHGGNNSEAVFDLNPVTGACRCWRATCDWRSSVEWFVMHYLDVSFERAVEIVSGEKASNLEELRADLQVLEKQFERRHKRSEVEPEHESIDTWVQGSKPLKAHPLREKVESWIKDIRGYDVDTFLSQHELYIPPQMGQFKGRVLFEVKSDGDRAYLAYAVDRSLERKTLNPSGKILSQMLYNYDRVKNGKILFVCEGIFDSARLLSFEAYATSLFGVNISPRQLRLLADTKAEEIVVCLDHGTEKKARDIATKIGEFAPDKKVSILRINEKHWQMGFPFEKGMDPDDLSEEQFLTYFKYRIRKSQGERDRLRIKMKKLGRMRKS
jgi:DNA primase